MSDATQHRMTIVIDIRRWTLSSVLSPLRSPLKHIRSHDNQCHPFFRLRMIMKLNRVKGRWQSFIYLGSRPGPSSSSAYYSLSCTARLSHYRQCTVESAQLRVSPDSSHRYEVLCISWTSQSFFVYSPRSATFHNWSDRSFA